MQSLPDPETWSARTAKSRAAASLATDSPRPSPAHSRRPSGASLKLEMSVAPQSPALSHHEDIHRVEQASVGYHIRYAELHSALAKAYQEQIRPCLDQIAKLRSLGFARELRLPSIVVIGDQSSGKSSVLESISGVSFPRGTGVVTLCPLQLSMRNRDDVKWRGHIRYFDAHGKETQWDIDSPDEVEDAINEAQTRITGNQKAISKNIIEMTLESPELPNLTLVDLPGIARYSHNETSSAELHKVTTDIIKDYIKHEESIILVVIPLTTDTATMEALQLAKDADPKGLRTIGVLTFPDLVNKGAEEEKLMIARNQRYPLAKGYITVKCRNQEEIRNRKSMKEARIDEMRFFSSDPFFSQLEMAQRGSDMLAKRLSDELLALIKKFVPEVISDVQIVRERLGQELDQMGRGPPEDDRAKVALIARLFNDFVKMFEAESYGKAHNFEAGAFKRKNLLQRCRSRWYGLAEQVEKVAQSIGDNDQQVRESICEFLHAHRGRELPSFQSTYPVVESIIRERLVRPAKQLALACLREISIEVDHTLRDLADAVFSGYPRLNHFVKESVQGIKEKMYSRAKDDLERQFEQETYVWTNDATYNREMHKRETTRTLVKSVLRSPTCNMYSFTEHFAQLAVEWIAERSTQSDTELSSELSTWFESNFSRFFAGMAGERSADESDASDDEGSETEVDAMIEKSLNSLHAYLKIAVTRMMDNSPLCMMHFMLYKLSEELHNEVGIYQQDSETLGELLEEKEGVRMRRNETKNRLRALMEAESELSRITL